MDNNRLFLAIVGSSLALVALLLGIAGFAAIRSINEQDRSFQLVAHTYEIKETTNGLLLKTRSLRKAQRNYVLTGNADFLQQFESFHKLIRTDLQRLWSLSQNAEQQRRVARFTEFLVERLDVYKAIIQMRTDGNIAGAEREMQMSRGKTFRLTRLADEITRVESEILAVNIATTNRASSQARMLVFTGLALSVLVIALSALFILRDFRHRFASERALRESSMRLQDTLRFQHAFVDSAAYGIIAADAHGIITEFNRTAEQMLGYNADEVVGRLTVDRFYDFDELKERAAELSEEIDSEIAPSFEALAANPCRGQVEEREWTYICKSGMRIPVQVSMTAIRANGQISGYLGIARDITERRKVERLKKDFVSTVSHELRTPLTSIRGSLGLVLGALGGDLSAQIRGLLQIAHNNAERLGRLINDILDVEKIESGKMDFKQQRQALAPLLQQAIDGTKDYARQFTVTFELFNKAPSSEVNVDADRFIQVMVNLLSNAAKFSPPNKSVTITAERHDGTVRISVADQGKGIPAEFQSRIFDRFAQADSSDSRQKSGTGLGLTITKSLIEKMNGLIGFDTQENVGTTFYVDLPDLSAAKSAEQTDPWIRQLRNAS